MKKLNIFLIALLTIACAGVFVACNDEDPTSTTLYKPTAASTSLVYTGETLNLTLVNFSESSMTVVGNSGVNAGDYTCTIALIDKGAYTWNDGTTDDVVIDWKIDRGRITSPTATIVSYRHTGSLITLALQQFDADKMTIAGNTATDVGTYQCTISLKDKANYTWSNGMDTDVVIEWSITADGRTLLTKPNSYFTWYLPDFINQPMPNPRFFDSETMEIANNICTCTDHCVMYPTVWLKDKVNYAWADGTDDDLTLQIELYGSMPFGNYRFSQVIPDGNFSAEINSIYLALKDKSFDVRHGSFSFEDMEVYYFIDHFVEDIPTINPDNKIDIWNWDPTKFDPMIVTVLNNLYFINNEIHFVYNGYTFVFSL